ncbi:MAG: phosphocholine cytidylyltransferase family protein [Candidatus Omnitrophota bacterium]|nr:MAG: phosphocholine cytidylyltransferase family protein [Candidatus Omnitrophota bacterium]
MKAIIIAAGMGSRLDPLTNDAPKCMLELNGKTLLQHQIEALRGAGINRISVIKGYKKEMIDYPDLVYYFNDDYQDNNILHSLFYAKEEMNDEFIAAYSDILYSREIVERLLDSKEDISIVVDIDWRGYYEGRTDHPIEEAENVIFDADNNVVKIGKILPDKDAVHGEFIGMMKCSKKGALIFRKYFNQLKKRYAGKPFQRASVFKRAYLTDIFQDMADSGIKIGCVIIERGWIEIDTIQDFKRAEKEFSKKEEVFFKNEKQ